jgi:hypothetical protein
MERSLVIIACALMLITVDISCRKSRGLSAKQLNPYQGAVKDILPQQAGDFMLVQSSSLKEIEEDDVVNARDGVGAIYNSSKNHTVQHLLVTYNSAAEANKELDSAEKRYADAHMKFRTEEVKDPQGQTVGRRLVINDGQTEAMNWTDGSLYCTAVSYTGYSSEFVKNLPY